MPIYKKKNVIKHNQINIIWKLNTFQLFHRKAWDIKMQTIKWLQIVCVNMQLITTMYAYMKKSAYTILKFNGYSIF